MIGGDSTHGGSCGRQVPPDQSASDEADGRTCSPPKVSPPSPISPPYSLLSPDRLAQTKMVSTCMSIYTIIRSQQRNVKMIKFKHGSQIAIVLEQYMYVWTMISNDHIISCHDHYCIESLLIKASLY